MIVTIWLIRINASSINFSLNRGVGRISLIEIERTTQHIKVPFDRTYYHVTYSKRRMRMRSINVPCHRNNLHWCISHNLPATSLSEAESSISHSLSLVK